MIFLRTINWLNRKWNNIIFWIHDLSAKWGVGHSTVWLYDKATWDLPAKWQLLGDKTYDQYLMEHELYIARHQVNYYANLAYDLQWTILDALEDVEET